MQVNLENIGAEDIVDGNPRLTLGLIWTIILRLASYTLICKSSQSLWVCLFKDCIFPFIWHISAALAPLVWMERSELCSGVCLSLGVCVTIMQLKCLMHELAHVAIVHVKFRHGHDQQCELSVFILVGAGSLSGGRLKGWGPCMHHVSCILRWQRSMMPMVSTPISLSPHPCTTSTPIQSVFLMCPILSISYTEKTDSGVC